MLCEKEEIEVYKAPNGDGKTDLGSSKLPKATPKWEELGPNGLKTI